MSRYFERVKYYYDSGLWSIDRVKAAISKWITEEEFKEITGESSDFS